MLLYSAGIPEIDCLREERLPSNILPFLVQVSKTHQWLLPITGSVLGFFGDIPTYPGRVRLSEFFHSDAHQ